MIQDVRVIASRLQLDEFVQVCCSLRTRLCVDASYGDQFLLADLRVDSLALGPQRLPVDHDRGNLVDHADGRCVIFYRLLADSHRVSQLVAVPAAAGAHVLLATQLAYVW